MEMGLRGKIALVTGSGRGIGKAIALGLAKEGVDVAINCVANLASAEETAKEVRGLGCRSMVVIADVASEKEVNEMMERVVREWGAIDILVNNAGIQHKAMIEDMKKSDWDRLLDIEAGGTFNCSKAVIQIMKRRSGGKIINISSVAGERMTHFGSANYTAAKAAILGFTRQLAYEIAPFKINVNAVCPWVTITPLAETVIGSRKLEEIKKAVPLRDLTKPEDVADTVIFLASDRARMITGYNIRIDGGMSIPIGLGSWDEYVKTHKEAVKKGK